MHCYVHYECMSTKTMNDECYVHTIAIAYHAVFNRYYTHVHID